MRRSMAFAVFFLLASAVPGPAALGQASPDRLAAESSLEGRYGAGLAAFEELARGQMAADHTTGLAIAMMEGDAVWSRAFGLADVENGTPMKPESSFRLASITKPMTAVAILQLVEKGRIDLDAPIQTYFPDFPAKKFPVTVRQLLGHLGGISHYKNPARELHIKEHRSTREAIAIFADFDLVAEPGTRYSYSTYGFNLLGAAIEGASGQAYGDYMRDHVWAPLGMKDTRMDDPREIIPNRVRGYQWEAGRLRNSEFVDISSRFAGGGTRTTVLDLLRFARGFVDGNLVSKASRDRMTRPMTLADGRYTEYGMGWDVGPVNGRYLISHSGGQNETRTLLFVLPARRVAIAAATNFESGDLFWYVQALAAKTLGELWDRSGGFAAYLPEKADRPRFAALRETYRFGLSSFERDGKAKEDDPVRLARAFALFNECVDPKALASSPDDLRKKCRDGLHPVSGEPITAVGSFMAKTLARGKGSDSLERFHAAGPVAFFEAYVKTYRETPAFSRELRFQAAFENSLARWARDWERTFNAETRALVLGSSTDLPARRLRDTFAGASIFPDRGRDIAEVARRSCGQGNRERALEAANLAVELYPESAQAHVALAGVQVCFGEEGQARELLRKARALEGGSSAAGPGNLNGMAYELAGLGRPEAGTRLLRLAIELHPKEANLYDSLGEIELQAGRREAATAAYRKALELDPKMESAANALKAIEQQR